jgi:molybdopterin/thiamine biosynthesis adenylyltransferase
MTTWAERWSGHALAVGGALAQKRLYDTRLHVLGTGGIGTAFVNNCVLLGVGTITTNDPQTLETDNTNRLLYACDELIGQPKVDLLASSLRHRRDLVFRGIRKGNGSPEVFDLCKKATHLACASNTPRSRTTAARLAQELRRPLLDIAVTDCAEQHALAIRVWTPARADGACPACYFSSGSKPLQEHSLLASVTATAGALASHALVQLVTGHRDALVRDSNLILMNLETFAIETMFVVKRQTCSVCRRVA